MKLLKPSRQGNRYPVFQRRDTLLPRIHHSTFSRKSSWVKRLLWGALFVGIFLLLIYLLFSAMLASAGSWLVVRSELRRSDAVAVLSGGGTDRVERAIELYKDGLAPRILLLLPRTIPDDAAYHDLLDTERRLSVALLKENQVPLDRVYWSDKPNYSTYSEALFLRDWMEEKMLRSAIVVSGYYQSRRAKWCMDRALRGEGRDIRIDPAPVEIDSATRWWGHEESLVMVENEYLKNVYYRIKGIFGNP